MASNSRNRNTPVTNGAAGAAVLDTPTETVTEIVADTLDTNGTTETADTAVVEGAVTEIVVAADSATEIVSTEALTPIVPETPKTPADEATWKTPTKAGSSPFAPSNIQHAVKTVIGTFNKGVCNDDDHPVFFAASKELNEGSTRCTRCVAKLNGTEVPEVEAVLNLRAPAGPTLAEIAKLFRALQAAITAQAAGDTTVVFPDNTEIEAAIVRLEKASVKRTPSTTPAAPKAEGASTTTTSNGVGGGRVIFLDANGVRNNMRYSEAAMAVAAAYPEIAVNCVAYKAAIDSGKQNNARLPLEKDRLLLPEGTITMVSNTGELMGVSAPAAAAATDAATTDATTAPAADAAEGTAVVDDADEIATALDEIVDGAAGEESEGAESDTDAE